MVVLDCAFPDFIPQPYVPFVCIREEGVRSCPEPLPCLNGGRNEFFWYRYRVSRVNRNIRPDLWHIPGRLCNNVQGVSNASLILFYMFYPNTMESRHHSLFFLTVSFYWNPDPDIISFRNMIFFVAHRDNFGFIVLSLISGHFWSLIRLYMLPVITTVLPWISGWILLTGWREGLLRM